MKHIFFLFFLFISIGSYAQYNPTVTTKPGYRWFLLSTDYSLKALNYDDIPSQEAKIGTIGPNKTLTVLAIDTVGYRFYKVKYKDKIGYIHKNAIINNTILLRKDPNIRPEFLEYILKQEIVLGMSEYEVACAWGEPKDKHKTIMKEFTRTQWVYSLTHYVYFENGYVSAMQN